jgi:murein DD-endopeptidase MepM/ murein hydrolase activator NlpD
MNKIESGITNREQQELFSIKKSFIDKYYKLITLILNSIIGVFIVCSVVVFYNFLSWDRVQNNVRLANYCIDGTVRYFRTENAYYLNNAPNQVIDQNIEKVRIDFAKDIKRDWGLKILDSLDESLISNVENNYYNLFTNITMVYPMNGIISSVYGYRIVSMENSGGLDLTGGHPGIDIANVIGTSVHSFANGAVYKTVWWFPWIGYGNYVIISNGNSIYSVYGHLSKFIVTNNQLVTNGEKIAFSGNTGYSTGPHLHFELRIVTNDKPLTAYNYVTVDPLIVLKNIRR